MDDNAKEALNAWRKEDDNKPTYNNLISNILKGDSTEAQTLAMTLKQAAYHELMNSQNKPGSQPTTAGNGRDRSAPTIPDPAKDSQLFALYTAFYKLPWATFVKDYDEFHNNPEAWKRARTGEMTLGQMELPIVEERTPPSADMALFDRLSLSRHGESSVVPSSVMILNPVFGNSLAKATVNHSDRKTSHES